MAKLSGKEKLKIEKQFTKNTRGNTWVGIRPVVFNSKKDSKFVRRQNKMFCSTYII